MLWNSDEYVDQYGLSSVDAVRVEAQLRRADLRVKGYVTDAAYADAALAVPTNESQASDILYAIADLAYFYLAQMPGVVSPVVKGASKSYSGIKNYSETYGGVGDTIKCTWSSEAQILARLNAIKRDDTSATAFSAFGESWGTGRVLECLEITDAAEEDDDEVFA